MDNQCCFRGDMFYANLSPFTGSEQGGYRPVIIVQNDSGNKFSPTVIVCAVTSKGMTKAHLPVHVPLPEKFGLEPNSIALLEQIRTIDKRRLDGYIGRLDDDIMQQIDEALAISVNLKKKEYDNGMLICLCVNCANVFYNSSEHKIHRADMDQTIKEPCTICSHHKGYDYIVQQKVKTHSLLEVNCPFSSQRNKLSLHIRSLKASASFIFTRYFTSSGLLRKNLTHPLICH